jgi:hypothetical protein
MGPIEITAGLRWPMRFRAERKRLSGTLRPGEEILASDALCTIEERPELTVVSQPVLVVTNLGIYVILSGKQPEVIPVDYDTLADVERQENPKLGSTLRLRTTAGKVLTFTFEPRTHRHLSADLITERFFGRTVQNTIADLASPDE